MPVPPPTSYIPPSILADLRDPPAYVEPESHILARITAFRDLIDTTSNETARELLLEEFRLLLKFARSPLLANPSGPF